jgi:hypothetical protein
MTDEASIDEQVERAVALLPPDIIRGPAVSHRKADGLCLYKSYQREYVSWCAMRQRCFNKKLRDYHRYGGRGIKMCERWLKFSNFLADMGPRPPDSTLDRINVDGHYEPTNCRWANRETQCNNQRTNLKDAPDVYEGARFGNLVVVGKGYVNNSLRMECICDCGNKKFVLKHDLRRGEAKSCGCRGKNL